MSSQTDFKFFISSAFRQIGTLLRLTFVQIIRRKAIFFYFSLLGFFLLGEWTCTTSVGGETSHGVSSYMYFILTSFWSLVFLVILTSDLLRQDMDSQVHTLWLSRPVDPYAYVGSKGLALLICVVIFVLLAFGISSWFSLEIPWEFLWYQGTMMLVYSFFVLLVLLVTLFSNQSLAIVSSLGLILFSCILDFVAYNQNIDMSAEASDIKKFVLKTIYWVLPQVGTVFYHSFALFLGKADPKNFYGPYSFVQVGAWIVILKSTLWLSTRHKEI
ncbi:ABC transporter permease [Leptospira andrefontaineae]|uniref:ABC transporter permease n=1 Tax=Leptospira andrefontaineae TaxID=2484976 RepID=A0A4R9H0B6_9LEPT|nr:ABC transporter permease [Leptospira andrefontaineae]TGK37717.1 ABC transporter permease [Leptospira andrefontaineae]